MLIAFTVAAVLAALALALAPSVIRGAADAAAASRTSGAGFVIGWFVAALLLIGVSLAIACIVPALGGASARVTVAVGLLVLGVATLVVAPVSARDDAAGYAAPAPDAAQGSGARSLARSAFTGASQVFADPASVLLGVLAGLAAVGWFGWWWVTLLAAVALAVIASLAVLAAWIMVTAAGGRGVASARRVLQTRGPLLRLLAVAVAGVAGIVGGVLLLTV